jgi:hypothetical protein
MADEFVRVITKNGSLTITRTRAVSIPLVNSKLKGAPSTEDPIDGRIRECVDISDVATQHQLQDAITVADGGMPSVVDLASLISMGLTVTPQIRRMIDRVCEMPIPPTPSLIKPGFASYDIANPKQTEWELLTHMRTTHRQIPGVCGESKYMTKRIEIACTRESIGEAAVILIPLHEMGLTPDAICCMLFKITPKTPHARRLFDTVEIVIDDVSVEKLTWESNYALSSAYGLWSKSYLLGSPYTSTVTIPLMFSNMYHDGFTPFLAAAWEEHKTYIRVSGVTGVLNMIFAMDGIYFLDREYAKVLHTTEIHMPLVTTTTKSFPLDFSGPMVLPVNEITDAIILFVENGALSHPEGRFLLKPYPIIRATLYAYEEGYSGNPGMIFSYDTSDMRDWNWQAMSRGAPADPRLSFLPNAHTPASSPIKASRLVLDLNPAMSVLPWVVHMVVFTRPILRYSEKHCGLI